MRRWNGAPPRSGLVQLKVDPLKGVLFNAYMVAKVDKPVKSRDFFKTLVF